MYTHQMDIVVPLEKPIDKLSLPSAITAYIAVSNLECAYCAIWIRNGLLGLEGVLIVESFHKYSQGIVAVTYDPRRVKPNDLLNAVETAGRDICRYYEAEFIGQQPALQATRL